MQKVITDDLEALFEILQPGIRERLEQEPDFRQLIEVILDLGREPEARFLDRDITLEATEVTEKDIE